MSNTNNQHARPTPHKWAEVIKAWADGHTVQFRGLSKYHKQETPDWKDLLDETDCMPAFNRDAYEWRVKPTTRIGWINIYPCGSVGDFYNSKNQADKECQPNRIACILITYTEGEGLDN